MKLVDVEKKHLVCLRCSKSGDDNQFWNSSTSSGPSNGSDPINKLAGSEFDGTTSSSLEGGCCLGGLEVASGDGDDVVTAETETSVNVKTSFLSLTYIQDDLGWEDRWMIRKMKSSRRARFPTEPMDLAVRKRQDWGYRS